MSMTLQAQTLSCQGSAPKPRPKVIKTLQTLGLTEEDRLNLDSVEEGRSGYGSSDSPNPSRIKVPRTHRTGTGPLEDLGIGPERITLFGAPPKFGKTSLVTQLAFDAVLANPEMMLLISNAEMSPDALMARQISRLSGVPSA